MAKKEPFPANWTQEEDGNIMKSASKQLKQYNILYII